MEVIDDPVYSGKLVVLLGGQRHSCYHATECPGAALCAWNTTWIGDWSQGMCMCNTKFGLTGANCDEWCAQAIAVLIINILGATAGLCMLIISLYLLFRFTRRKGLRSCACKPVGATLFLTTFGTVWFVIAPIIGIVVHLEFPKTSTMVQLGNDPRLLRRPSQELEYANNIAFGLAYCFTVCSFVILPLTWVARSTLRLRPSQTRVVMALTVLIALIIVAMQLPFYVLAASRYRDYAPTYVLAIVIAWIVIFPFVIFLNLVALIRIRRVSKPSPQIAENNGQVDDSANNKSRQLLHRIQISAVNIIIACAATLALTVFNIPRSQRGLTSDPRCYFDAVDICFRFSMFSVLYGCGVALWFLAPSALGWQSSFGLPSIIIGTPSVRSIRLSTSSVRGGIPTATASSALMRHQPAQVASLQQPRPEEGGDAQAASKPNDEITKTDVAQA